MGVSKDNVQMQWHSSMVKKDPTVICGYLHACLGYNIMFIIIQLLVIRGLFYSFTL